MTKDIKFGAFLKEQRKRNGLSQYQLGKLLGVSDRAVSKWENGLSKPNTKLLAQIGEILCLSIDELLATDSSLEKKIQVEISKKRKSLWNTLDKVLIDRYGESPAIEIISRYEKEKLMLSNSDILQYFNLISLLKLESKKNGNKIKVMGGIGASFIAYLLDITDINPLPPHYYCPKCKSTIFIHEVKDEWDIPPKKCSCCQGNLKPCGHNIPFEVYKHIINNRIGFDIVINKRFYKKAEQFIVDTLSEYSLRILNNPIDLYHGKIASDAITFVIQPVNKKRYVKKENTVLTVAEYLSTVSDCTYINLLFDENHEKLTALETFVARSCGYNDFANKKMLDLLSNGQINKAFTFKENNFCSILKKYKPKTFNEVIHAYGIAMLYNEYPSVCETMFENLSSIRDVIVFRDDVFDLVYTQLRTFGCFDTEIAYLVMNNARKGIYSRIGIDEFTRNIFKKIELPNDFIVFLESATYLFNKATSILYLREELLLLWYFIYHPKEYKLIFQNNDGDIDKKCVSICK